MISDIPDMWHPILMVKSDCSPHDQLRLLEAWEAWEIPLEQQWAWSEQLFGVDDLTGLSAYLVFEMYAKDNQLELLFDSSTCECPPVLARAPKSD